jgi:uncharacterized membrane protein YcaP (DUF421 family)
VAVPPIQWDKVLALTVSPVELFLRGTLVYLFIFALMRVLRREPGTVGIADLLMVVLIADASQNAMSDDYQSVTDGLILASTIIFWNYTLDWLSFRLPFLQKFTHPHPIPLISNGKIQAAALKQQLITQEQLMTALRKHGVDSISNVKAAYMEGNGDITVITPDQSAKDDDDKKIA